VLDVLLNDTPVGTLPLQWNPDRVGAYELAFPRQVVKRGTNRLVLRIKQKTGDGQPEIGRRAPGLSEGDAFVLWYVRVRRAG
jgi:hypothetical protein